MESPAGGFLSVESVDLNRCRAARSVPSAMHRSFDNDTARRFESTLIIVCDLPNETRAFRNEFVSNQLKTYSSGGPVTESAQLHPAHSIPSVHSGNYQQSTGISTCTENAGAEGFSNGPNPVDKTPLRETNTSPKLVFERSDPERIR